MFISNGFVYGREKQESIKITDVEILPDRMMLLTFTSGERRLFDASILNSGIYEGLKDDDIFNNPKIEYGVITWANGAIDCAPEFIYNNSYEYPEDEFKEAAN